MYTAQALWTMAREGLDVISVIYANRSYAILNFELERVGGSVAGERARSMLNIASPALDWVALARGMGVAGVRVDTAEALDAALARAVATPGPHLIEAVF
jgi:acetolactate synthase-1/2/3 large subunit